MTRITAIEAGLIQRNITAAALAVAKCDTGIDALKQLARSHPELRVLARSVSELRDHATPMLVCEIECAAVAA